MNLVVDIGNTVIKTACFKNNILQERNIVTEEELAALLHKKWDGIIISSVRKDKPFSGALLLDQTTPLPITSTYATPQTLGVDRIAAVVGANYLFPSTNCLVLDIGTCITYDLITNGGVYEGGIISPGWQMRLDAMHKLTAKLPSLEKEIPSSVIGKSTVECMQIGAYEGFIGEINGIIEQYNSIKHDLKVLICGGDAKTFESKLKAPIFAEPNLVLIGLNRILEYNNAQ